MAKIVLTPNNIGSGLEVSGDKFQVKLGSNLSFDGNGAVAASGGGGSSQGVLLPFAKFTTVTSGATFNPISWVFGFPGLRERSTYNIKANFFWTTSAANVVPKFSLLATDSPGSFGRYIVISNSSATALQTVAGKIATAVNAPYYTANSGSGLTVNSENYFSEIRGAIVTGVPSCNLAFSFICSAAGQVTILQGSTVEVTLASETQFT